MRIPQLEIVMDGVFALDGGSIWLSVSDASGRKHDVQLERSLPPDSRGRISAKLLLDEEQLPIRGEAEATLLEMLRSCTINSGAPSEQKEALEFSSTRVVLGDDIQSYMGAIDQGPTEALAHLVRELIQVVESADYPDLRSPERESDKLARLIIVESGSERLTLMKLLRLDLGLSLSDAKIAIDTPCAELPERSLTDMRELKAKLEALGAQVELVVLGSADQRESGSSPI